MVVEAKLLVDAALAGHAQHQLGAGADHTGHFHLLLLYRTRFHYADRIPKCMQSKEAKQPIQFDPWMCGRF